MKNSGAKFGPQLSSSVLGFILVVLTVLVYFFSNPTPQNFYDYTFRVAENLLQGSVGFAVRPPSWLNEFVPFEGFYYSVFPLGAVLSMIPFAMLWVMGVITEMPGALIAALLAGGSCFFLLKIADRYEHTNARKILLSTAILFGTWTWTNVTFDGAWQLALGFAMVGELGAIYFTVFDRRPLVAGAFFALAFGNRTEVLLTAPIFFYLLIREDGLFNRGNTETQSKKEREKGRQGEGETQGKKFDIAKGKMENRQVGKRFSPSPRVRISAIFFLRVATFCVIPFLLGVATLIYNYVRFHSFTDFGYARIPGVLDEPWYNHGIFSIYYVPRQGWEMLGKMWKFTDTFPYLIPDGFSSSILLSSPFLFFLLRTGARGKILKYTAWAAIAVLTFLLWIHGNSGGWQFGYRYAMILLPWVFVILLENSPKKITPTEWILYGSSFVMNAYATWLFHWTDYIKP